jgi:FkbM family methyltransferase
MPIADLLLGLLRPYRFRGKARLLGGLAPRAGTRRARVFGATMDLDLSEFIQRMIYLGAYEREETALLLRHLRPGMTVVDVGANVGYYSLAAAARVGPTGRVIAVEPSPYAADRLERTIRDNRLSQVRVERHALGSRPGEFPLYQPLPDNHTPSLLGEPGRPAVSVSVRTLDACLQAWQVDRVDLLKVDVEGYEFEVLAGAATSLAGGRVGAILCEFNDFWLRQGGGSGDALYRHLRGLGFVDAAGDPGPLAGRVITRFLTRSRREPGPTPAVAAAPPTRSAASAD